MTKIIIFLNAGHQRKYVQILSSAMAGCPDVTVESVELGIDDEAGHATTKTRFMAKLKTFTPFRLAATFIGAIAYLPYTGFLKLYRLYRLHGRGSLHSVAFTNKLLSGAVYILRHRPIPYVLLAEYRWQRHLEHRLFSLEPDLIVLLEDNAEGLTGLVSHGARVRRIPYVILPDYIPNPAEPARYYFNDRTHSAATPIGQVVRRFAPQWVLEYNGRHLLRLPGTAIAARWMRGQHCPQPWILNAGYTSSILLESVRSRKHYESLGFKREKLEVVGGAVEDGVHAIYREREQRRTELEQKYKLDPAKPLIVCGFPPDQYSAAIEGFEFTTYDDLCRNWFAVLQSVADRANVIVIRHPRTEESYLCRYASDGVQIGTETLENILPVSDFYLACVSTTIRWALALGIPVVNYDTYRYDYGDFSASKGCFEVTSIEAFRDKIETLLQPGELDRVSALAAKDADQWGLMDGKFKERLRRTLLEIRESYTGLPTSTHHRGYRLPSMS